MSKATEVKKLVDRIEKDVRALAEKTGDSYISLCLIDDAFSLDNGGNGFYVYRKGIYRKFEHGGKRYE